MRPTVETVPVPVNLFSCSASGSDGQTSTTAVRAAIVRPVSTADTIGPAASGSRATRSVGSVRSSSLVSRTAAIDSPITSARCARLDLDAVRPADVSVAHPSCTGSQVSRRKGPVADLNSIRDRFPFSVAK
jgi:hypothetical protein